MKFLKKWWPSIAHAAAVGVIFLAPGVQGLIAAHPGASAGIGLGWGLLLHWAQSPNSTPASKF
jgi:hypothetical protein